MAAYKEQLKGFIYRTGVGMRSVFAVTARSGAAGQASFDAAPGRLVSENPAVLVRAWPLAEAKELARQALTLESAGQVRASVPARGISHA
ncbi:MAG: hypothetical protein HGA82_02035 [Anaerolineales bacterium]|nr:hypothetical protein [Anaerolineales bacterium]